MPLTGLVSAEEYLHTSFEHDAEFVEGRIVERPVPIYPRSCVQGFLIRAIPDEGGKFKVLPEQRIQTRLNRFRVADICVITARPGPDGIVREPPYLCIEILSPEESNRELQEKIREYLEMGVRYVWIIDPKTCLGHIHTMTEVSAAHDKIFSTDAFSVNLAEVNF